ncbi:MAG: hypothetical protein AAB458_02480 [Patescibacteria group bacterium]
MADQSFTPPSSGGAQGMPTDLPFTPTPSAGIKTMPMSPSEVPQKQIEEKPILQEITSAPPNTAPLEAKPPSLGGLASKTEFAPLPQTPQPLQTPPQPPNRMTHIVMPQPMPPIPAPVPQEPQHPSQIESFIPEQRKPQIVSQPTPVPQTQPRETTIPIQKIPDVPRTPVSYREPILEIDKVPFVPVTPPPPPPKPAPLPPKNTAIRTLQSDIAETVQGRGISVADIALAEQKRSAASGEHTHEPKQPTNWWAVGAMLFVLLGVGVTASIFLFAPKTPVDILDTGSGSNFPADKQTSLDVTEMTFDGFTNTVRDTLFAEFRLGTLMSVSLFEQTNLGENISVNTERFFSITKSRAPDRLIRSLEKEFVFGVATVDTPTGFLVFTTQNFENTFAGMLEWEPFMVDDLPFIARTILPPPIITPEVIVATTSTSTLSASTTPPMAPEPFVIPTAVFKDIIVQNEDTRAAVLPDGTIRLLYSFPDRNTLIIAQSKETLTLILERINTARFTR